MNGRNSTISMQGCIYFLICGDNNRTTPCEGRKTKSEKKRRTNNNA